MLVNKKELAEILGFTERSLTDWQADGMPIAELGSKGRENSYETSDVIKWMLTREAARQQSRSNSSPDFEGSQIEAERERKIKLEADLLQLTLSEREGTLLAADSVEQAWSELIANFKSRILAIPSRAAIALTSMTEVVEIETLLSSECTEALEELARPIEYDHT